MHAEVPQLTHQRSRAVRLALAALVMSATQGAQAVDIQDLKPLSVLGEPLRALITLSDVQAADLDSLQVRISPTQVYRSATLSRAPELANAKIRIQPGADHTAIVELTTSDPINVPVLDLLLDVTWTSGQLNQQFIVLLDAPGSATQSVAQTPQAPNKTAKPVNTEAAAAEVKTAVQAQPEVSVAVMAEPEPAKPEPPVMVVKGDTLSELMITHRYGVGSLAQRMIATQRANTNAFIRENINLVRAGAQLRLPSRETILSIDASEAQRLVNAQMADFDAYRRRLAAKAPQAPAEEKSDQGKVENAISGGAQEQQGDRLALTNGSAVVKDAEVAAQKAAEASQNRQSELSKNIAELKELAQSLQGQSTPTNGSAGASSAAGAAGSDTTQAQSATNATPAPAASNPAPTSSAASNSGANQSTAPSGAGSTPAMSNTAAVQNQEPQWITDLKSKPWLLPAVGLLLVVLALLTWLRRSSNAPSATPKVFDEEAGSNTHLEPDSTADDSAQAPSVEQQVPAATDAATDSAPEAAPESDEQGEEAEALPTLPPENVPTGHKPLHALMPDIDLDLPNLDEPVAPQAESVEVEELSLLAQAKMKLRDGDVEGARVLAEQALSSPDTLIQENAQAFLERL